MCAVVPDPRHRLAIMALMLSVAACSDQPTESVQALPTIEAATLVGAGNVARCDASHDEATALLLDGKLNLDTFTDAMVQRPEARALMSKVRRYRMAADKVYSGISVSGYTDISVTTPRGRYELRIDRVPGSPAWPLTDNTGIV